jgi:hypothetical protein
MGVAVELYIVEIMIANPNSTVLINIEIMFYIVPLKKFTQHLFVSLVIRFFSAVLMLRGTKTIICQGITIYPCPNQTIL